MSFTLGAPQMILIVVWALMFAFVIVNHGKPRDGHWNAYTYIIVVVLYGLLLWWGGFF